jgi:uncharacterized protein YutD
MKYVIINDRKFELIENYKDGYNQEEIEKKLTDFFDDYDYIIGDWSYGKLRLKGFCKKNNPKFGPINDFDKKAEYIKKSCAYDCKYFVLERI